MAMFEKAGLPRRSLHTVFWLFFLACIPAFFFISPYGLPIPKLIYWLVIVFGCCTGLGLE
jgi:hypothetical protein